MLMTKIVAIASGFRVRDDRGLYLLEGTVRVRKISLFMAYAAILTARLPVLAQAGDGLVATHKFENGSILSIYSVDDGVLVTEEGLEQNGPLIEKPLSSLDSLQTLWRQLVPEEAVPEALVEIDRKIQASNQEDVRSEQAENTEVGDPDKPMVAPAAVGPAPCGNGCCNYEYLRATFSECNPEDTPNVAWFYLNYPFSSADYNSLSQVSGMACAAVGTSQIVVHIGSYDWDVSVPEATYFRWWWHRGFDASPRDLRSSVNSSTNQHLHTYCGTGWRF
jgi:hypothetical protein